VGQFAVQLAAIGGATVTAAAGSAERAAELLALGAASAASYEDDLGGPFNAVMESVGGPVLEASLRSLAPGGVAVLYGTASGEPARITLAGFAGKHGACIRSFYIYQTGVETFGQDLGLLVGLVADGRLRPQIGITTSWRKTAAAIQALRERRVRGKVVLLVD
jgi:NADPH:quinone reductase-like Zn-dependent oxidoreductase